MKAQKVIVIFLHFIYCFVCVHALVQQCTHTSAQGDYYDLSPLADCDLKGYTAPSANASFQINICTNVAHYGCETSQACCELIKNVNYNNFDPVFNQVSPNYGCGSVTSATFTDLPSTFPTSQKGTVLTYNGGTKNRTSVIALLCDPSATTPIVRFVQESPLLTFHFEVNTSVACPQKSQEFQKNLCPIFVFLVPHTHDDVGWLITPDQYYEEEVKNIIDTVLVALVANPARRFIYVEQAFFYRWWTDTNTTDAQRKAMKGVVANGQLEFVLGGWTMPDEAITTYTSVIDEYTLGHSFLFNTFGVRPTKGWQIDPFGASSTTPTLGRLAGFDVQFIDRVSNKDQENANQRLQFNWQGSPSLGEKAEIMGELISGSLYCDWLFPFDFTNDPVNEQNVEQYGKNFVQMAGLYSTYYRSPHVLAEWGCDFAFQNATAMFNSMDKVVAWLQSNENTTGVFVKYSVLSDYSTAVFERNQGEIFDIIPTNIGGDFFPLKFPGSNQWCTGFYTSRALLKGLAREGEALGRTIETLYALVSASNPSFDSTQALLQSIVTLRMALAEATHHDGITGTSTPLVVESFQQNIINGMNSATTTALASLPYLINVSSSSSSLSFGTGALLTITNGQTVAIVLYNSLAWEREEIFNLPVNRLDLVVYDSSRSQINCQINDAPYNVDNVTSSYRLFFPATVPSFGFATFYVSTATSATCSYSPKKQMPLQPFAISNKVLTVSFSGSSGKISNISNSAAGVNVSVEQDILKYYSDTSGPYNFGPLGDAEPLYYGISAAAPTNYLSIGPLVSELVQVFPCTDDGGSSIASYALQIIRLYSLQNFSDFLDLQFSIGPLPSHTEVVVSFSTGIDSRNSIFTDSNGYEFQERTAEYDNTISGNYFPMVYASYIKDYATQLSLISERAHGAATLSPGQIEIMLHRNPNMAGDGGPALSDFTTVFPKLRLLLSASSLSSSPSPVGVVRTHAQLVNFALSAFSAIGPYVGFLTPASLSFASQLPPNIHLLTFAEYGKGQFLLRLTHLYAVGDDPVYSKPVSLDLSSLFLHLQIAQIQETTLTANKVLVNPSPLSITLSPKDIRTFLVSFK